jgi:phage terminase large subunit GpA-like protein
VQLDNSRQINRLIDAFCVGLQPPPALTVSEWADEFRRLSPEASALRGQWRTYPYQKEPLDVLSPSHPCQIAVYMSASQMMKTELLLSLLGYVIHMDPGPALFVEPREQDAKALSKDRVAPMIRDTPVIHSRVRKGLDDTTLHKSFTGGHITFAGAISPSGLAMRPIRYLFLDEVDRYLASAGKEGNPISLAIRRTDTFPLNRKIAIASSPTFPGNNIDLWYQRSDQRKFHVPCPMCGHYQVLWWKRIEWPEAQPLEAQFRCAGCQQLIPHFRKAWMISQGRWIADNPASSIPGFWLPKQYTIQGPTWGQLAEEFLEAQKNPETLKAFYNTVLAETYEEKHETKIDEQALASRVESFGPAVPEQVAVLTAGVDVQGNRLEVEIVGWGRDEESWSIAHKVITGNPERPEVWAELDAMLQDRYENELGIELPIKATCIDSSDNTTAVYRYTRERLNRKIYAIKGRDGYRPIWPKKVSRGKNNSPVFILGVDAAKDNIYERLKLEQPGPGYCHFPNDRDIEYFEQLTAERKYARYHNGFKSFQWKKSPGARNEALDIRVYAYAALHSQYMGSSFNLNREAERMAALCDQKREQARLKIKPETKPALAAIKLLRPRYNDNPYL